jgi:hypothetical protein
LSEYLPFVQTTQLPPQLLPPGDRWRYEVLLSSAPRNVVTEHHWHPQTQKNQTIQTIQKPKLVENMFEIKTWEARKTQIDKHPECSERQGQRGLSPITNLCITQYMLIIYAVYTIIVFQLIIIDAIEKHAGIAPPFCAPAAINWPVCSHSSLVNVGKCENVNITPEMGSI